MISRVIVCLSMPCLSKKATRCGGPSDEIARTEALCYSWCNTIEIASARWCMLRPLVTCIWRMSVARKYLETWSQVLQEREEQFVCFVCFQIVCLFFKAHPSFKRMWTFLIVCCPSVLLEHTMRANFIPTWNEAVYELRKFKLCF